MPSDEIRLYAKYMQRRYTEYGTKPFVASFSDVFADIEAPGGKVGTTNNLPLMQGIRSVTVSFLGYCSCLTGLRKLYINK